MLILKFKQILEQARKVSFKNSLDELEKCDIIFFCHDVDRSILYNNRHYSPLVDSVKESFEAKGYVCQSIALPWSVLTGKAAYGSPICINRSLIIKRAKRLILRYTFLSKLFKVDSIYSDIFKKSEPKLVISIGCSDEFCFEARKNNIFHVELLHGMGYTKIEWGWNNKETKFLPQGILALDVLSFNTFKPLKSYGVDVQIIPHPFLKRFFGEYRDSIPEQWLPKKKASDGWSKEILISLNWGYAGDHGNLIEYKNILRNGLFYEELEQVIKEETNVLFRFRFHPKHLKNTKYRFLLDFMNNFVKKYQNTEWHDSSFLPYPSILERCCGNIGMSSTSCYDAAAFGVNSLMLCPNLRPGGINEDWFVDLEREGYVQKCEANVHVIKEWIRLTKKQKPRNWNLDNSELWKLSFDWMIEKSKLSI